MIGLARICKGFVEAVAKAIMAGCDMIMATPEFFSAALKAVEDGELDVTCIHRSVERILLKKFELGLFEKDRAFDAEKVAAGTIENRVLAEKAAKKSLVMLKNDGLLPISVEDSIRIVVLVPNADDPIAQNGDWPLGSGQDFRGVPPFLTVTVVQGLRDIFPKAMIKYKCGVYWNGSSNIPAAIKAAERADVIIVVVGDVPKYIGEYKSTATLRLMGGQEQLLVEVSRLGIPYLIDVISSKPLVLPNSTIEAASAIIWQFSPGMLGGRAFAKVVAGKFNPSGRLPISIPCHVGQHPVYYNQRRGRYGNDYADMPGRPRWSFGLGIGFCPIKYRSGRLDKKVYDGTEEIEVKLILVNEGKRNTTEVVQVYVASPVTSVTWAVRELKAFAKVKLAAAEKKEVKIRVKVADCGIVGEDGIRVVRLGDFEIQVGESAAAIRFILPFRIV
jgi:beta-glucosidase